MNDTLEYVKQDPIYRRYHHRLLTFSLLYAFSENYILPFSHDEVVHLKGAMWAKAPGDEWQKAATLRAIYGYMYSHPGKQLLFMGAEIGQHREWNHDRSLDWHLLERPLHRGLQQFVKDLNRVYAAERSLYECDASPAGFQWIDCNDSDNSVVALLRRAEDPNDFVVAIVNFTPVPRHGYVLGAPRAGRYDELLNSDAAAYGGTNVGNDGVVYSDPIPSHGHAQSLRLTLPPLGFLLLKPEPLPAPEPAPPAPDPAMPETKPRSSRSSSKSTATPSRGRA
jgi:1,4-alpha-glucan branching enzyme